MSNDFSKLPEEMQKAYTEDKRASFHRDGKPSAPKDYFIREDIKKNLPLMVLGGIVYIYDKGVYKPDYNGTTLKSYIGKYLYPDYRNSRTINRIYEYFLMDADIAKTISAINQYPVEWVPFKNAMYDPIHDEIKPHDPKYYAINQLSVSYGKDHRQEITTIDKWLNDIFPNEDDQEMFLQYCGLCMNRDTRFQKSLFLTGPGGTGKSTIISFISGIIGSDNISTVSLEQLGERFYPAQLFGKLFNACADLKTTTLNDTDVFKRITGEDTLMLERKGKDPFIFNSYAKLMFSVNEMPTVKGESTNGFYRRLLILPMRKADRKSDPELLNKLNAEKDYFVHLCIYGLRTVYEQMAITESRSSSQAVETLRSYSDSVQAFLAERCSADLRRYDWKINRRDLYEGYVDYCREYQRQPQSNQNFYKSMDAKGFPIAKSNGAYMYKGIVYPALEIKQAQFVADSLRPGTINRVQ